MEANLVLSYQSFSKVSMRNIKINTYYKYNKLAYPSTCCVLTKPPHNNHSSNCHVYKDNWFDHLAINHLSQSIQATTGNYIFSISISLSCSISILGCLKKNTCFLFFILTFCETCLKSQLDYKIF